MALKVSCIQSVFLQVVIVAVFSQICFADTIRNASQSRKHSTKEETVEKKEDSVIIHEKAADPQTRKDDVGDVLPKCPPPVVCPEPKVCPEPEKPPECPPRSDECREPELTCSDMIPLIQDIWRNLQSSMNPVPRAVPIVYTMANSGRVQPGSILVHIIEHFVNGIAHLF